MTRPTIWLFCLTFVAQIFAVSGAAFGDAYGDSVLALNPSHYYRLDEETFDTTAATVIDIGSVGTNGTHEGLGLDRSFQDGINVGDGSAVAGVDGPDVNYLGVPFAGLGAENYALFNNNSGAVNLGPGTDFADPVMTVAFFFKTPCDPDNPGVECQGSPASSGGERLFSNNFNGVNTGGSTPNDDLGHLQIDYGWGANLIISIDNNFNIPYPDPNSSNFQVAHGEVVVKDNNWHHLVVSRNGDDINDVILVVDGENITSDRWTDSTDSWGITAPFDARIGTRTTAPDDHTFNGWLDDVGIWLGRQLTVEEAQGLWRAALDDVVPFQADFDVDGDVDGDDFLLWQDGFGIQSDAVKMDGDYNNDGKVDGDDFLGWQDEFGAGVDGGGSGAVPEPTSLLLLLLAIGGALTKRRH